MRPMIPSSNATQTTDTVKSQVSIGTLSTRHNRAVWIGRVIFLACLGAAAAALGVITFRLLQNSEQDLAQAQFEAIADRAVDAAFEILHRKRLGTVTMADLMANINPNADAWPFVTVLGYESIATKLIETSSGREMGFCPLVQPHQLQQFEDFAYDYYYNKREPTPFPNTTATSSFGRGVWGSDPNLNTTDNRYHETPEAHTSYNSPNRIFAPILHHNAGPHKALMLNLHFQETRGTVIDNMMACAQVRKATQNVTMECGALTDKLILTSQEFRPGPGALLMMPIYPARSPFELKGLIASSIIWDEVLTNVFTSTVRGVDCVLTSPSGSHTYRIDNGQVFLEGEGDLHETQHEEYCQDIDLITPGVFSQDSVPYQLTICPSDEYFESFSTNNPMIATIGSVGIIIFSVLVFFAYDRCVRKEFHARQALLEAKRKFVRFVSHEVRTPLNSVCMGLALIKAEMSNVQQSEEEKQQQREEMQELRKESTTMIDKVATSSVSKETLHEWFTLVDEVLDNAQNSVDVLNDLLNYDKIELGTFNLELEIIPIASLVEKTVKEFKLPASKKQVDLTLHWQPRRGEGGEEAQNDSVDTESAEISKMVSIADPFRLSQVLRNLISNAVKFTPAKGKVQVHVSMRQASKNHSIVKKKLNNGRDVKAEKLATLKVEVTDSGAGMTPEQLSQLFRQGTQFNAGKLQHGGGSGLGLFIAKGIVEQHGGYLKAGSRGLGEGTTFTLSLPLYKLADEMENLGFSSIEEVIEESMGSSHDEPRPQHSTIVHHNQPCSNSTPARLHILVVDDSATNRRLLLRWLHRRGHICEEATDGVEAVEMVTNNLATDGTRPFDTILMDFEMPRMNGPKATSKIRQMGCDAFIVGISGNVLPEDVAIFRDHGANAVLPKPVQFPDLENLWYEYGVGDQRPVVDDDANGETSRVPVVRFQD